MIKGMLFTEYNEVEHEAFVRTMERNEGRAEVKTGALINLYFISTVVEHNL